MHIRGIYYIVCRTLDATLEYHITISGYSLPARRARADRSRGALKQSNYAIEPLTECIGWDEKRVRVPILVMFRAIAKTNYL